MVISDMCVIIIKTPPSGSFTFPKIDRECEVGTSKEIPQMNMFHLLPPGGVTSMHCLLLGPGENEDSNCGKEKVTEIGIQIVTVGEGQGDRERCTDSDYENETERHRH